MLVAHTAVDQQDGHVNDVEVWEYVAEAAGGAVSQRPHQVTSVVEVPRHSPETWGQELAVVDATVSGAVRALDVRWLPAPDGAGALGAPEQVLLVVGGAEDVITGKAEQQDGQGVGVWELDWLVHQVQTLKSQNTPIYISCRLHESIFFFLLSVEYTKIYDTNLQTT